ncbi:MAG: SDR family oxidoreductase, partial [Planctomycetes bacterium]|nr:SDR family oxidoreductase [Planctomycetota bacterium]
MRILLTGATGYVGGVLLPELERRGHVVRCLARRPAKLTDRVGPQTEVMAGDAADPSDLACACADIDTAYWLVHSMESGVDFERADRLAAERFAAAAQAAGVKRIVYLGGLGADDDRLSAHLRSRHEVGAILRASGLDVVEFRASIIVGAGSFSFDLVRTLVERLPVMICPAWLATPTQPIAIADVVAYLAAGADLPPGPPTIFEIGGPDKVSYGSIMQAYARQRGLRRLLIPVPVLTPRLSSLWLKLVTPRYSKVGRKLIDGLKNPTVVTSDAARREFAITPRGLASAVRDACAQEDGAFAVKRWADVADLEDLPRRYGGSHQGTRLVDHRHVVVAVPPERAFAAIEQIGGGNGWYAADWLWTLRGWLDRAIGGPGMSRGRRDPERLRAGDVLDCWRVEVCDPPRRLRLAAEMKLPGRGWLEFEVVPGDGECTIHQTAVFDPRGLGGLAYWYAIWPLHELVFARMLAGLAKRAV